MKNISKYLENKVKAYYSTPLSSENFLKDGGDCLNKNFIFFETKINNIRRVNKLHELLNINLNNGGLYMTYLETLEQRRVRLKNTTIFGFKNLVRIIDFIYKRLFSKLPFFKFFYFLITKGNDRVISKAESLGRLISCGFEVLEYFEHKNLLYIISKKKNQPEYNMNPSYGILFKMKRIGYKGKIIYVYKIRTMHPYSEYCQELIIRENKLANSGKILNDFRITTWGKLFRKFWIDEIPMFINLFKGDLNIVGVRPLSLGYFNKYPKELQELRIKIKPGLIPPYYVDLPNNFEEILLSEKKYILKKIDSPIKTDIVYFYKAILNIVIKGARSN